MQVKDFRKSNSLATPADQLDCQVESSYGELGAFREEWDQAVLDLNGPIYMSYDWTRLWWQFYGEGCELRVFIFRNDGRIVGIVPIYIDTFRLPLLGPRLARLVGASIPPKVFNPPVDKQWSPQVWREVVRRLFDQDRCDLFSLGLISTEYTAAESLPDACRKQSDLVASCEIIQCDVCTVYQLPETYERYFESLDSKERKVRRKKLRELEAVWPVKTEIVRDGDAVVKEFENFAEQHTCQWQAEGRPGHFQAWPNALDYNRALVKTMGQLGRVRFYKLFAGQQVITRQYAYAFGNELFAELPTRVSGPEWERFSLGCTSQIKLIEATIGEGIKRLNSGLGHYAYKILSGGKESPVNMICMRRTGFGSKVRVALYRRLSKLLRLVFHKIWYRNIMPRLPKIFRSGQSRLLLRFEL